MLQHLDKKGAEWERTFRFCHLRGERHKWPATGKKICTKCKFIAGRE